MFPRAGAAITGRQSIINDLILNNLEICSCSEAFTLTDGHAFWTNACSSHRRLLPRTAFLGELSPAEFRAP